MILYDDKLVDQPLAIQIEKSKKKQRKNKR